MTMLNDIELAVLANKLQVPMIISDILNREENLNDEVKYSLHEMISDLQPDSALLAIALGALKISNLYRSASSGMDVMGMEAQRIIAEYGEIWVKNANSQTVDNDKIFDVLINTTEDLESMAELLDLNCSFLRSKDTDTASLCDVLYVQATSHALIAEAFMNAAGQMVESADAPTKQKFENNVIAFPNRHAN